MVFINIMEQEHQQLYVNIYVIIQNCIYSVWNDILTVNHFLIPQMFCF